MKKQVILTILSGSFTQGFKVLLKILTNDRAERQLTQAEGELPPDENVLFLSHEWQRYYSEAVSPPSRLGTDSVQVTNISIRDFNYQFILCFNNWLNSEFKKWQKVRDTLQQNLAEDDEILFIIETSAIEIHQLPWQQWDLFSNFYKKSTIIFRLLEYQTKKKIKHIPAKHTKILLVLGDSKGINIQSDRFLIESLTNTKVQILVEPRRRELIEKLCNCDWDILFFAGHSTSRKSNDNTLIYINSSDPLTIRDLKNALQKSVANGLKLAMFNSCDGLGLARELACLQIPQIIVMSAPVPDKVAQEFLKYFLLSFATGKPAYLAFKEAQEKLQGLEDEYPCASWLPVMFHNIAEVAPWQTLNSFQYHQHRPSLNIKHSLLNIFIAGTIVTTALLAVRKLEVFRRLEIQAFDTLLVARPPEKPEPRILLVTVNESDLHLVEQRNRKGSLSDLALEKLLQKLEQYNPRVIGLDIYRDFPADPKRQDLVKQLQQNERLIVVCKESDAKLDPLGVNPPPEVPLERRSFSDFVKDSDNILRRHLLAMSPDPASPCAASYAFSTMMAFHYLAAEGIMPEFNEGGFLKLGNVTFYPLESSSSSYEPEETLGIQILLNYRSSSSPNDVFSTASLTQVLKGQVNSNYIKDKIVLIGTTANSFHDFWLTPYNINRSSVASMPGVIAQAQMISQILSAVLDRRPILHIWSFWQQTLWIFGWSIIGGILGGQCFRSPSYLILFVVGGELCLYVVSYGLLISSGYWVPLVPSSFALFFTSSLVWAYFYFQDVKS